MAHRTPTAQARSFSSCRFVFARARRNCPCTPLADGHTHGAVPAARSPATKTAATTWTFGTLARPAEIKPEAPASPSARPSPPPPSRQQGSLALLPRSATRRTAPSREAKRGNKSQSYVRVLRRDDNKIMRVNAAAPRLFRRRTRHAAAVRAASPPLHSIHPHKRAPITAAQGPKPRDRRPRVTRRGARGSESWRPRAAGAS